MKRADIMQLIKDAAAPRTLLNIFLVFLFAAVLTGVLVSKYFFFQAIADSSNKSKVTVAAPKDIEVVDTIKTEKKKREVSNNVPVVYSPADDAYIKNNLDEIIESIMEIRRDNKTDKQKRRSLEAIFDISDTASKPLVFSFFLYSSDAELEKIFKTSENTLSSVLNEGITEKDVQGNTGIIAKSIKKHIEPGISINSTKVITALLEQVIVPNMLIDEEATKLAKKIERDKVKPVIVRFAKGDIIVNAGDLITQVKKEALSKSGYNILKINYTGILGIFCLVCIGVFSIFVYLKIYETKLLDRKHFAACAFLSLLLAVISVLMPNNWSVFLLPVPFFAIMISVFLNPRSSFFITVVLLTIITFSLQFSALAMSVFLMSSAITAAAMKRADSSRRFDLIRTGFFTSIAMSVIIFCVYYDLGFDRLLSDMSAGFINGFVSGVFALGMVPVIEGIFKIITPFGLAELGDYNQPLLKKLHETAPGTFEHSLRVSNLAETAAEAVGADPVLARVGALYHDAGKMIRPLFFVENQTYSGIENPHDKLTPRSSKMVITSHTKDGIALAKEYHIPEIIQEFMIRHHGTSLASYFYNQAAMQEGAENVSEEQFRYTGPKPNSKETAIVMIADAVESASRTLKDHSQEELDALINKIIKDRLDDNQLDESPLTLKDIKTIAASLSRVLRSVFHKRIKYQETSEELKNKVPPKQDNDDKA